MQNAEKRLNLLSLLPEEIYVEPAYRKKQIFSWLGKKQARSFEDMTDLPKSLRGELAERYMLDVPEECERRISADGTQKILWRLTDGERIETALMCYKHGNSICISTQAGCRQGCAFCASGSHGLSRNLSAGEMMGQILYCGLDIGHIVLMGTGEPLDNYDETIRFLKLVSHQDGRGLSPRHISLSTCGVVPGILELAELGMPVTLSISLHAPDDATRNVIMPINRRYPVAVLLDACEKYFEKTGRRISYEYVIIDKLNDSLGQARQLAALLKNHPAHINIIPYNPVPGKPFAAPKKETVERFVRELRHMQVTVRRTLGSDIEAACGQMRAGARSSD